VDYHLQVTSNPAPAEPGPRLRRVQREVIGLMRPYEVMVILDARLDDDVIRAAVDRSTQVIRAGGGTPGKVDRWGKRRFAYELRHQSEGYYVVIEATAEPEAMADLDRMLHLADEVVRHKIIRLPDKVAGRSPRPAHVDSRPTAETDANGA
jgi:small subunit ribosomal protein S6